MIFESAMRAFLQEDPLVAPVWDAKLLQEHFKTKSMAEFIYMGFGETWYRAPAALRSYLGEAQAMDHGYQFSPWGKPSYRAVLRDYILRDHGLPLESEWQVAYASTGSRMRMYDFSRLLRARAQLEPAVIYALPSWDYHGVFCKNGFRALAYDLRVEEQFQPQPEKIRKLLEATAQPGQNHHLVVVINAQHNPSGVMWQKERVAAILALALEFQTSVLIDDAYYGLVNPGLERVSVLALLHELLSTSTVRIPWLAVRSLGKQFHCNGWGLGAVVGESELLHELDTLFAEHTYSYGGAAQSAMSQWLLSPLSTEFLCQISKEYAHKKAWITEFLSRHSNYPREYLYNSETTPHYLLRVPEAFQNKKNPDRSFNEDARANHNLFLSRGSMVQDSAFPEINRWFRLYLGAEQVVIVEALKRISQYSWEPI